MNREQAKKLLPIIQAFADGETIQSGSGSLWVNMDDPAFNGNPDSYRIKPKPLEGWMRIEPERTYEERSIYPTLDLALGNARSLNTRIVHMREVTE